MADKVWVSNTGDVNAISSWNPAGVPVDGDNLIFGSGTQQDITSNLSTFSSVSIGSVWFLPTFTGAIGAEGNYFDLGNAIPGNRPNIFCEGTRDAYLTGTSGNTGILVWDSDASLFAESNLFAQIAARKGIVNLVGTSTIAELRMSQSPDGSSAIVNALGSGGPIIGAAYVAAGVLNSERTITQLDQSGGTVTQEGSTSIATLNLYSGTMVYNSTGAITNMRISGGVADFTQTADAKSVSADIWVESPGELLDSGNLTWSFLFDLRNARPVIK